MANLQMKTCKENLTTSVLKITKAKIPLKKSKYGSSKNRIVSMNSSPLIFIRTAEQDTEFFQRSSCGLIVIPIFAFDSE